MGCDTHGKVKGFVRYEDILNFIVQKYDPNATCHITRDNYDKKLSDIDWPHKVNEHSEKSDVWYTVSGFINFDYYGEDRQLFYHYGNINSLENLDYYTSEGLEDMVRAETTFISLGCWGHSVDIIREIVAQFGGGWVDNNDCDDKPYYPVEVDVDGNIKPIIYVTMEDIYEKFGGIVVIQK